MADSLDNIKLSLSPSTGNQTLDQIDPFEAFVRSTASAATLEMFGHHPSPEVEQYRSEHPALALMGEMAGIGGAYGAAFRGLEQLPKYNAMLDTFGAGDTILSGAARGGVGMGTVEAGRVAGAAVTGGDVPQTAEEGITDTAMGIGLGGIGGLLRAGGKAKTPIIKGLGEKVDLKDAPQVHLKAMQEALTSGGIAKEDEPAARALVGDLQDAITHEEVSGKYKYVNELEDGGDAQPLNRLFKTGGIPEGKEPDVVRKRLVVSGRDFSDVISADDAMKAAGVDGNLDAVQFPRILAFNSKNGARSVESEIKTNMLPVGENEFLAKEKNGLYVYAKKLVGQVGDADSSDRWTIFKTTDPNRFSANADFAKTITDRNAFLLDKPIAADPANPRDIFDEAQKLYNDIPMKGYYQAIADNSITGAVGKMAEKLGISGESEVGKRLRGLLRETFAPGIYEYKNNPRAQYLFSMARSAFEKAGAITHAMTFGDEGIEKSSSLWGKLFKGNDLSGKFGGTDAFANIIHGLSKDDVADVVKAWDKQYHGEALAKAVAHREISPAAHEALQKIDKLDEYMLGQTKATMEATGQHGFTPIKGHYLMPRTWEGDWRVPIFSDSNKLVYVASGKTKVGAEQQAAKILANDEVKGWYSKDPFLSDTDHDFDLAQQVRFGSPEHMTAAGLRGVLDAKAPKPTSFKVRTGVQGYQTNFTKDELINKFYGNLLRRNRYLAEVTNNKLLGSEMTKLALQDKPVFDSLTRRMEAMAGRQGTINRAINDMTDKVLAPALGKNSASTIARTINRTFHHLTIGAFNLQRPIIDSLTFMQTVLPRVAFTISASEASLHQAYSWLPVVDRTGMVKGSIGWLEPFRLMKQSFQEMKNPSDELRDHFSRALRAGTISPKFIEEWVGQSARQAGALKDTLRGEQGYGKFLEAISNFLPSTAEKLSRGNAFTVGHLLGRNMGLEGDGLYRFAKEFTEKTTYTYSTADRPRAFTGPVGSVFGQFKNWGMNYIGNFLEYAGEGYNHNNWAPLVYQMAGTTALGGLSATALWPAADNLSKWMTNKSAMENLYEKMGGGSGDNTRGNFADAAYMGVPAFLGLSLSGGVADPFNDPSRDAAMLYSFVQMNRAQALGKALGQAWENFKVTGQHPIDSEATRDLVISALAPKVFQRVMSSVGQDGIKSLNNGGMIINHLNLAEKMMYDAGFMPKRIELAKDINEELWRDQEAMKGKVEAYGRMWHDAEVNGAYDVLTDINKAAMVAGVPIDRVISTAKAIERKESMPQLDRRNKEQDLMKFKNLNLVGGFQ